MTKEREDIIHNWGCGFCRKRWGSEEETAEHIYLDHDDEVSNFVYSHITNEDVEKIDALDLLTKSRKEISL